MEPNCYPRGCFSARLAKLTAGLCSLALLLPTAWSQCPKDEPHQGGARLNYEFDGDTGELIGRSHVGIVDRAQSRDEGNGSMASVVVSEDHSPPEIVRRALRDGCWIPRQRR